MATKTKTVKKSKAATKLKDAPGGAIGRRVYSIVTNKQKTIQERVAALAQAPLTVSDNEDNLKAVLDVLLNVDEPIEVRMAAMQSLQAASFSVIR